MNKFLRYSFIALLAMVVGNVMAEDVFVSDFSYATGEKFTGGGDGTFTGSVAATKIQSSNAEDDALKDAYAQFITQWVNGSLTNVYWANQSVKLGTSSKDGSMTSVALGDKMTSNVKVTINVAGWGSGSNSMTLAASTGTVDDATVTLNNGEFSDFTFYITGGDATTALTISGKRMFVKSVKVETVSGTPIHIDEPEFSVPAGTYTEPQTVAMTCATEGAKILYTIPAGQDPEYIDDENVTGVWYDGTPLEITRTTTIKAMAVKDGKTSNIVTATYTISTISGQGTLENPYTVADAITVTSQLEKGQKSEQDYYIKGKISEIKYTFSAQYGTATFFISDDGNTENQFQIYGAYYLENKAWVEGNTQIAVGDDVIIYGKVMNYNGTLETSNKEAYIYSLNGVTKNESGEEPEPQPENQDINVAKALEVINALENGATTSVEYKVTGYVVTVTEISTKYGNATFTIADQANGTDVLTIFRAKDANGNNITNENLLKAGDLVVVQGKLQKYVKNDNITPELTGGKILTVNGVDTGISNVTTAKMVNGARYNLAGQRVNAGYKGVVIMNGQKMLVK